MPLERSCVRFIDNFSKGTRGAKSVEQFLEAGYAVIFLSRRGSAQPFVADYQEEMGVSTLTDFFDISDGDQLAFNEAKAAKLRRAVSRAHAVTAAGTYLNVPFETLFEYMSCLEVGRTVGC